MPRRTPVREIISEENVVDSPIRRSSRIAATTPTPTPATQGAKVTTRRNSSSSESGNQTSKPARGRSSSQEGKEVDTPKRTSRSSSKSPTTLLKEQNIKSTPTATRTRRASRSGTDDESSQPATSTSSDVARRLTRRNSFSEKAPSLEKIEETDAPQPQKRLTRRRSSSSESGPLTKITENTEEEKPANMETIQENTEEDQELSKDKEKANDVIKDIKTKSPVVVMERLKRRSFDKNDEVGEKKRKADDGVEQRSVESEEKKEEDEPKVILESDVIVEENTLDFADDNKTLEKTTDVKAEETDLEEQQGAQKSSKESDIEETDIEVENLNLQVTLENEEVENENFDNSGSSDKENLATTNIVEEKTLELKTKTDIPESSSAIVVLKASEGNNSNIKTSANAKKHTPLESDDISMKTDKDGNIQMNKIRKSVSPSFESDQMKCGEKATECIKVASSNDEESVGDSDKSSKITSPKSSSNIEINLVSSSQEQETVSHVSEKKLIDDSLSKNQEIVLENNEESVLLKEKEVETIIIDVEEPALDKSKEEITQKEDTNAVEKKCLEIEDTHNTMKSKDDALNEPCSTSVLQNTIIEIDKNEVNENPINEKNMETLPQEETVTTATKDKTKETNVEMKTPSKNILNERKNFNELINDESDHETPKKNESFVANSNDEDSVIEIEESQIPEKEIDIQKNKEDILEPGKDTTNENEISDISKNDDVVNEKNSNEIREKRDLIEQTATEEQCSEKITEEEQRIDNQPSNENLTKSTNVEETQNEDEEKSEESLTVGDTKNQHPGEADVSSIIITEKADIMDDEEGSSNNLTNSQSKLTSTGSEDIFPNEPTSDIPNDKNVSEVSKAELRTAGHEKKIINTKKIKSSSKRQGQDDDLNSDIDESELADINEFLCQVTNENDSPKPNTNQKHKESKLASKEKQSPIKKPTDEVKDHPQENKDLDKSKEKQKSLKSSDDQSESSIREKVNDILKNKALYSDTDETDEGDVAPTNEFIDDMAEEAEEDDAVFEDSNEIPCEGESINSSDTESEHEEDTYEDDSFIDDEDENVELLSGSEEYLIEKPAENKKRKKGRAKRVESKDDSKKYARIVSCSISSSDNESTNLKSDGRSKKSNVQEETIFVDVENSKDIPEKQSTKTKTSDNLVKTQTIEVITVEEEEEVATTICVDSDSEDVIMDIKMDPNDTRSSLDSSRRSSIKKSSVNIQENISLQDIEDGELSQRITKVVEWFCSGMKANNDMSGNISLNVSLDYNDGQNKESPSVKHPEIQIETKKRKSAEFKTAEEPSPRKIQKTVEGKVLSPDKKKRKFSELCLNDVNVETIEENGAINPAKATTLSDKIEESEKTVESAEENENNDVFSQFNAKEDTVLPSSSNKESTQSEPASDNFDVTVQSETVQVSPLKTKEPTSITKSKSKKIQSSPLSVNKKKSKQLLCHNEESSNVTSDVSKKAEEIDVNEAQTLGQGKKNKKKSKNTIDADEAVPPTHEVDINVNEPSTLKQKKKKKSKDVIVIGETVTHKPKITEVMSQSTVDSVKERTTPKKQKKGIPLQLLKGDSIINEGEESAKTVDIKKKQQKRSDKKDEVKDKKKLKAKTISKDTDEAASQIMSKEITKKQVEQKTKGKKRTISDLIPEKHIASNASGSPKQRKLQIANFKPTLQSTELKIQHLDDWSNSPAQVTPTLSEIPEEHQRKYNKKKMRGNTQSTILLIPSLNMDDSAWETEAIAHEDVGASKHMKVIKKKRDIGASKVPSFHPKDFKNQMLHCMGRVDRMDTKILLRNKKMV